MQAILNLHISALLMTKVVCVMPSFVYFWFDVLMAFTIFLPIFFSFCVLRAFCALVAFLIDFATC